MADKNIKYTHRFLARIVMEAQTPLAVGSGEKDIVTDALVATDVNGLPYIPGTTLAGIIRHAIDDLNHETDECGRKYSDLFFGYQEKKEQREKRKEYEKKNNKKSEDNASTGSEIIFSEAKMIGIDGKAVDGLQNIIDSDKFYQKFKELPIRQHAKIDHKGVTVKAGKFDEQVVFKGTRFCFELEKVSDGSEMVSEDNKVNKFKQVLNQLQSEVLRIGSGTRCGFGEMKVISCQTKQLDLQKPKDLEFYLQKSSSLADDFQGEDFAKTDNKSDWTKYELTLQPDDFFLFGSGFGDAEADMTPVKENIINWKTGKPAFTKDTVLIPATSIKGALAHRVAFYYNKKNKFYAGDKQAKVGNENIAVQELFGYENQSEKVQKRGNVIFSDIIEVKDVEEKILNHVSIDRFTGGAIDGALFTEKTIYGKGKTYKTTILVNNTAFQKDKVQESFENALTDICSGMLPLGGGVNRGNGIFTGELKRNGETIYPKNGGNEK